MRLKSIFAVAALGAAVFTITPIPAQAGGTDILHWMVRKTMTNEDTNSAATAWVDLKQNTQGKADNQRLELRVRDLTNNAPYQLWALIGEDTNYVHAADFTTNDKGDAKLSLMHVGSSQGKGKGKGKGKAGMPAELLPISQIRELAIGNAHTQAVFTANLLAPDKLHFLIKRHLRDGDVAGDLRIHSTTRKLQFQLKLTGLSATNDYHLAVNDAAVAGGRSSTNGTLTFKSLPVNAADILTVHKLSVLDSGTNTVLSTTLP